MQTSGTQRLCKKPMAVLVGFMTKALLTGVLILLAGVFLWQAWRIWANRSLVLAPFDFLEAGKPSAESGEQFTRMIRADLTQLASLYNQGEVPNTGAVPSAAKGAPVAAMALPAIFDTSFFETMELKAYGLELGSLVKALRRHLESPSEISGNVTHQGDKYSVFVELNQSGAGPDLLRRWTINYAKDLPEASSHVACRIFRHLASEVTDPDAALFRGVDDEDFCLFNRALTAYDQYRDRKPILSTDDATALLKEADAPLTNLVGREPVTFPYVYKLAALVFFESKKYAEAERAAARYAAWLAATGRNDVAASDLQKKIQSQKLQTTAAVSKQRPLRPGISVGLAASPGTVAPRAGMLTCIVQDQAGARYLLSPIQVLGSKAGATVLQPAVGHGGGSTDIVADVTNATDAVTLAKLRPGLQVAPEILQLGAIKGLQSQPAVNKEVVAYGFDGERRIGKVISVGGTVDVEIESNQIVRVPAVITSEIAPRAEVGAPVVTADGYLVGMVFAASTDPGTGAPTTLVLPIEAALKQLGVELVK